VIAKVRQCLSVDRRGTTVVGEKGADAKQGGAGAEWKGMGPGGGSQWAKGFGVLRGCCRDTRKATLVCFQFAEKSAPEPVRGPIHDRLDVKTRQDRAAEMDADDLRVRFENSLS
jgi:hypothetical protein